MYDIHDRPLIFAFAFAFPFFVFADTLAWRFLGSLFFRERETGRQREGSTMPSIHPSVADENR